MQKLPQSVVIAKLFHVKCDWRLQSHLSVQPHISGSFVFYCRYFRFSFRRILPIFLIRLLSLIPHVTLKSRPRGLSVTVVYNTARRIYNGTTMRDDRCFAHSELRLFRAPGLTVQRYVDGSILLATFPLAHRTPSRHFPVYHFQGAKYLQKLYIYIYSVRDYRFAAECRLFMPLQLASAYDELRLCHREPRREFDRLKKQGGTRQYVMYWCTRPAKTTMLGKTYFIDPNHTHRMTQSFAPSLRRGCHVFNSVSMPTNANVCVVTTIFMHKKIPAVEGAMFCRKEVSSFRYCRRPKQPITTCFHKSIA